jgi:Tfp pilus assembly PilM family ATPase
MKKVLTGLELSASSAKMVQIAREKHAWKMTRCVEVSFPLECMDISNKTENIMVAGQFLDTIRA